MSEMSDYLEQKLLDHTFNEVAFTSPITIYVSLYTTDPTDADTGTEVSGGAYARVLVNENGGGSPAWDLAVVDGIGYMVDSSDEIPFITATASWGTVTHVALHDAITAGNMLMHTALDVSKAVGDGDTFKFPAGDLKMKME